MMRRPCPPRAAQFCGAALADTGLTGSSRGPACTAVRRCGAIHWQLLVHHNCRIAAIAAALGAGGGARAARCNKYNRGTPRIPVLGPRAAPGKRAGRRLGFLTQNPSTGARAAFEVHVRRICSLTLLESSSVAQWLACQAHNLEDPGSRPG